jgi:hypothetical protein
MNTMGVFKISGRAWLHEVRGEDPGKGKPDTCSSMTTLFKRYLPNLPVIEVTGQEITMTIFVDFYIETRRVFLAKI